MHDEQGILSAWPGSVRCRAGARAGDPSSPAGYGCLTSPAVCGSSQYPLKMRDSLAPTSSGYKKNRSLVGYGPFTVAGGGLEPPTSGL